MGLRLAGSYRRRFAGLRNNCINAGVTLRRSMFTRKISRLGSGVSGHQTENPSQHSSNCIIKKYIKEQSKLIQNDQSYRLIQ